MAIETKGFQSLPAITSADGLVAGSGTGLGRMDPAAARSFMAAPSKAASETITGPWVYAITPKMGVPVIETDMDILTQTGFIRADGATVKTPQTGVNYGGIHVEASGQTSLDVFFRYTEPEAWLRGQSFGVFGSWIRIDAGHNRIPSDVTGSRTAGTTYTNGSPGISRSVDISAFSGTQRNLQISPDGTTWTTVGILPVSTVPTLVHCVVPPTYRYRLDGAATISLWVER